MRHVLLVICIATFLSACFDEKKPSKLLVISDQITQRYENSRVELDALTKKILEEDNSKLKESVKILLKGNLSESERKKIVAIIEEQKKSAALDAAVILESQQAMAELMALISITARLCENSSLKLAVSKMYTLIASSFKGTEMNRFYLSSMSALESELEHNINSDECDKFNINANNMLGDFFDAIEQLESSVP